MEKRTRELRELVGIQHEELRRREYIIRAKEERNEELNSKLKSCRKYYRIAINKLGNWDKKIILQREEIKELKNIIEFQTPLIKTVADMWQVKCLQKERDTLLEEVKELKEVINIQCTFAPLSTVVAHNMFEVKKLRDERDALREEVKGLRAELCKTHWIHRDIRL